jgi:hypothetical protein
MSTGGAGHTHSFDPISGWCEFCNLRDDNRLLGKGGDVLRKGRDYSTEELEQYRQKASAR